METVTLNWYETDHAIQCGVDRCISSWKKKRKHAAGYKPKDLFATTIKSAAAEMAVAKKLGIYWDGSVDTFKEKPDLDPDIEVRMSMMHPPLLIIRPNDIKWRRYVLVQNLWVHGHQPAFKVLGYTGFPGVEWAHENWSKYWTDFGTSRPKCWALPVDALQDIQDLK